jgi:hypothetical protein
VDRLCWAQETRPLRRLKQRITQVGGCREQPRHDAWLFDDAHQWELLWKGEEVVWKVAPSLREAGYASIARSTARTNRTRYFIERSH